MNWTNVLNTITKTVLEWDVSIDHIDIKLRQIRGNVNVYLIAKMFFWNYKGMRNHVSFA